MDASVAITAGYYAAGGAAAVGLVTGLVKAARTAGMPSKFAPLASVGIGVALCCAATLYASGPIYVGVVGGIATGLSSCGIYDIGKFSSTDSATSGETTAG